MCAACSPGGRFLRLRAIATPEPLLLSLMVAAPTLSPLASRNSTTTGFSAAHTAAAPTRATTAPTIPCLVMLFSFKAILSRTSPCEWCILRHLPLPILREDHERGGDPGHSPTNSGRP